MTKITDLPLAGSIDADDLLIVEVNGVTSRATTSVVQGASAVLKGNNLSDLPDKAISRSNLGVDPAGTDNSTDVTLVGSYDYLTISAQEITLGQVDLSTDVTGNIQVSNINSGTNANTSTFLRGDGTWVTPVGSGDMTGPASSVDSTISLFDGATGKILKTSSVSIDGSNNISTSGTLTASNVTGTNTGDQNASQVSFNPVSSVLTSTDVQAGLDELGSLALLNDIDNGNWNGDDLDVANGGTGASTSSAARTNLGLEIGTDVQAHSSILDGTTASYTSVEETKLAGIETGATADMTTEEIQDAAWGVLTGDQTLISVVYQDNTNDVDFIVDSNLANYNNGLSGFITASSSNTLTNKTGSISQWTNDVNYLTSVNNTNWLGEGLNVTNGGTGGSTVVEARTNLDVYSKSEVDSEIAGISQIFTNEYISTVGYTNGATVTFTHGLGGLPKMINLIAVCTSAQAPYSVGEELYIESVFNGPGNFSGISAYSSSTTTKAIISANGIFHGTTLLSDSNFDLKIIAWA